MEPATVLNWATFAVEVCEFIMLYVAVVNLSKIYKYSKRSCKLLSKDVDIPETREEPEDDNEEDNKRDFLERTTSLLEDLPDDLPQELWEKIQGTLVMLRSELGRDAEIPPNSDSDDNFEQIDG
jgi:hypothetical protein